MLMDAGDEGACCTKPSVLGNSIVRTKANVALVMFTGNSAPLRSDETFNRAIMKLSKPTLLMTAAETTRSGRIVAPCTTFRQSRGADVDGAAVKELLNVSEPDFCHDMDTDREVDGNEVTEWNSCHEMDSEGDDMDILRELVSERLPRSDCDTEVDGSEVTEWDSCQEMDSEGDDMDILRELVSERLP